METGKIKTLFTDIEKTEALFPRTKTSAVTNNEGVNLDALLEDKASAGFGYGESMYWQSFGSDADFLAYIDTLWNEMPQSSTKQISFHVAPIGDELEHSQSWIGTIYKYRDTEGHIKAISYRASTNAARNYITEICRNRINGAWDAWEWVNPPMRSGIEYRTTKRYGGNVVYERLNSVTGYVQYRLEGTDTWSNYSSLLGAAPAGFGLGDGAPVVAIEDIDNMDSCGWFYATSSSGYKVSGKTLYYLFVRVDSWKNSGGSRRVTQTAYNDGRVLQRWQKHDGTWNEWEWVNPPMESGVEYCTTERWKEKSVYTKLINCGTLASGRNVIAHNLVAEIIRYGGSCDKNALPYIDTNNNGEVNIAVSSNNIILNATSQFAGKKAYIQLWYVKG
jgi:hypothetical protein